MELTLHSHGATFCEFPIIFCEREAGHSKFSRKILYEGMRFPLKALGKRISGGQSNKKVTLLPCGRNSASHNWATDDCLTV